MLVTLRDILRLATARGNAVGAFNTPNLETLNAVLQAASRLRQPVVVMHAQIHEEIAPLERIGPVMLQIAEQADVPVCVHLDHGEDIQYIKRALNMGFTSVMYDGSGLEYNENVANTCLTVSMAAKTGASVEGEIGIIGGRETSLNSRDGAPQESLYTDPATAVKFVRQTGIDALACAFGTAHGVYANAPRLDFQRLQDVASGVNIPVVMHEGSGLAEDEYRRAISSGVRKINYFTYLSKAGGEEIARRLREASPAPQFHELSLWATKGMEIQAEKAIQIFSEGK